MGYKETYAEWLRAEGLEEGLREELKAIAEEEREQEERFYTELEFGTAGLRGIIGAGTNRMNVHVVRRATQGLADYLNTFEGAGERGVAIAYDSRIMSREFALETALVLANNGIRAYLYDTLHSVPQLSFTVLHLKCIAGVVITASHNPPQYNGYKVYWEHGGQAGPEQAGEILKYIQRSDYFAVKGMDRQEAIDKGLLVMIGKDVDEAYYAAARTLLLNPELVREKGGDMSIVYTPLHGSGSVPVQEILRRIGMNNISVVKEQEQPDGNFPTVKAPNPEDPNAFTLAMKLADETGASLILGTDPDADRLGVGVRRADGGFNVLTGNQIGSLLLHYILSTRAAKGILPKNGLAVKSLVSTSMADKICAHYGIEIHDVLTGFRFISEEIAKCQATGEHTFLFGFEESYGFLAGTFARDKDAVSSAVLLCEAAVYYREQGKTLYDVLREMYGIYGFFKESVKSYTLEGKEGLERIAGAMTRLRAEPPKEFAGEKIITWEDFKSGRRVRAEGGEEAIGMPQSNVLRYFMDKAWLCIRPSGTEPKLKLYIGAGAPQEEQVDELLNRLMAEVDGRLKVLLEG